MTVFLCEDSVCGILTGVYDAWDSRLGHANVKLALKKGYQPEFFTDCREVGPDAEKADKVLRTLDRKCTWKILKLSIRHSSQRMIKKQMTSTE